MLKNVFPAKSAVTYKLYTGNYFKLSSGGETVTILFEERQYPKLPSELVFAECVLKMRLSSLA